MPRRLNDLVDALSFMRKMKPKRSSTREDYWTPKSADTGFRHVSDSGLRINNEPMPMKDKKPVLKHPNAVDNFWNTHQAEYDERVPPPNRCGYVDSHNDACPKLKDELDKKRGTAMPIACQTSIEQVGQGFGIRCATQTFVSERDWSDPRCIMCSERKKYARQLSIRKSRRDRRTRQSRVSKSKRRPPPKRTIKINKAHSISNDNRESQDIEHSKPSPKNSKASTRYPDSTTPSHTSYNSFLSMDHEPMV